MCALICTNYRDCEGLGEPHQSCCPSNGQLGLTQSEVNYSHISVSMCVCVSMRRVDWTLLGAPMC